MIRVKVYCNEPEKIPKDNSLRGRETIRNILRKRKRRIIMLLLLLSNEFKASEGQHVYTQYVSENDIIMLDKNGIIFAIQHPDCRREVCKRS